MKTYIFLLQYLAEFFFEWKMFQKHFLDRITTDNFIQ
jgi:hypothetical protein